MIAAHAMRRVAHTTHTQASAAAAIAAATAAVQPAAAAAATRLAHTGVRRAAGMRAAYHTCSRLFADAPAAGAKGPKVAGGGAKKKGKEAVGEAKPLVIPTSMSQYSFAHFNVLKEYKNPDDKVSLKPDSAYPAWIWDQTPEPAWSDLLLTDFAQLPTTYQKKVFSMPRKIKIKKHNDLTKKG